MTTNECHKLIARISIRLRERLTPDPNGNVSEAWVTLARTVADVEYALGYAGASLYEEARALRDAGKLIPPDWGSFNFPDGTTLPEARHYPLYGEQPTGM